MDDLPKEMIPVAKERVYDLVARAGLDVSDWGNFKGGPAKAAVNPRYCYEWAFVEPTNAVVLNLWINRMVRCDNEIEQAGNFRADSEFNRQFSNSSSWARRAKKIDTAIQLAARENLPVRIIVLAGDMRGRRDPNALPSAVHGRCLDPVPWHVKSYDGDTGSVVLRRGVRAQDFVDQFNLHNVGTEAPGKSSRTTDSYDRDPRVRLAVLKRSGGICEFCGEPGFKTCKGKTYLETHHIIPLSEGGPDTLRNVIALCPNDHKQAHFSAERDQIRAAMINIVQGKSS